MRFSEAMRLGAMLRPRQAYHLLYDPDDDSTCAMGAACEAVGILDTAVYGGRYSAKGPKEWKWLKRVVQCPACDYDEEAQCVVFHLNNQHRWTREKIADWISGLEEPQAVGLEPAHSRLSAVVSRGSDSE